MRLEDPITSAPPPAGDKPSRAGSLLGLERLTVDLPGRAGPVRIVDGVTFTVPRGQTVGLIGESGSGKTITAMSVIGLLPPGGVVGGRIDWQGEDLVAAPARRRRQVRGREISMIFQDPMSALNPTQTIGRQVGEILRRSGHDRQMVRRRVIEMLDRVGIPDSLLRVRSYPHQLSGGLRQRAMIALALMGEPALLLADEPTTALDVTVQSRILALLSDLQQERGLGLLLVSHDLRVVANVADGVVVLYAGRVAETGPAEAVLQRPAHPYTQALAASVPRVRSRSALAHPLPGAPADPAARPPGCAFHPRCPWAVERCKREVPQLRVVVTGRSAACHRAEEVLAS